MKTIRVTALAASVDRTGGAGAIRAGTRDSTWRNLVAQCANCHGTNGRSVAEVPSLAGQSAAVLAAR